MGKATMTFREVRFVFEDELTQVYVHLEASGDAPLGVQGWHHKTFAASVPASQILEGFAGKDDPVLWALQAPQNRV